MKTLGILTIKSEFDSVKKLGFPTYLGSDYLKYKNKKIIIRWGNSFSDVQQKQEILNPASSIYLNCDKYASKKRIGEYVLIPKLYSDFIPENVLAVVRPKEHTGGQNFKVVKGPYELGYCEYGSQFLSTEKEFRVWFAGDALLTARRIKMKINPDSEYPCRSEWGYSFMENKPILSKQTLLGKRAIGLDFGCADVLRFQDKYYFLELNSAPSIDHSTLVSFYQTEIKKFL